jgi:hypothetical protein
MLDRLAIYSKTGEIWHIVWRNVENRRRGLGRGSLGGGPKPWKYDLDFPGALRAAVSAEMTVFI